MKALEFKTLQQAAQILGVSQRTLERHLKRHADGMPDGSVVRPGAPRPTLISTDGIDYLRQEIQPRIGIVADDGRLQEMERTIQVLQAQLIESERDKCRLVEQLHRVTLEAVTHITKLESRNLIERIARRHEGKIIEALTATNIERDTNTDDTASTGQKIISDDDDDDDATAQR